MKRKSGFWVVKDGAIIRTISDSMTKTSQGQPNTFVEKKDGISGKGRYKIIITQKGKIILERLRESILPIDFEVIDKVSLKKKTLSMELLEMIDESIITYYFNSKQPSFSSVVEFIVVCFGLDKILSDRKTKIKDISFSRWAEAFYTLLDNGYIQIIGL